MALEAVLRGQNYYRAGGEDGATHEQNVRYVHVWRGSQASRSRRIGLRHGGSTLELMSRMLVQW